MKIFVFNKIQHFPNGEIRTIEPIALTPTELANVAKTRRINLPPIPIDVYKLWTEDGEEWSVDSNWIPKVIDQK